MTETAYQRLSAQDRSFVLFEGPDTHMHVSAIAVFDAGPVSDDGRLDIERVTRHVASRLPLVPRYRQRLAFTPLQRHPVWVDDEHFDVRSHVRHVAIPKPGHEGQLKELAGRILSQRLDRDRPLWEIWLAEGLEGDRFAAILKVHHCLVDGVTGVGLMHALLSLAPDDDAAPEPQFRARPAPSGTELLLSDLWRAVDASASTIRSLGRAVLSPLETASTLAETGGALWDVATTGLHIPDDTPLNRRTGTQRRLEWIGLDLDEVKAIRKSLDGTVNDVVVAVATGGLRRFLKARRAKLGDLTLRIVMPVDMHEEEEEDDSANHVSALFLELPLAEPDPRRRFRLIRDRTRRLKQSRAAMGIEFLHRLLDWSGTDLVSGLGTRLLYAARPHNLVVTNVPGPQIPLYLLGAKLHSIVAGLPLFHDQGLGVAAMSYLGQVQLGLVADWNALPDLSELARAMTASFAELREAARKSGKPRRR